MTKKIFRSILMIVTSVILISLFIITGVLYGYFTNLHNNQLASSLSMLKAGYETDKIDYFNNIEKNQYRITLIDTDGVVLFDSMADENIMENHSEREEIKEAMESGVGKSSRYSSTILSKTIYYAERLSDGRVLRLSLTHSTIYELLVSVLKSLIVIFILAIFLSSLLAKHIAKKIVLPLNSLDLNKPLENETYDEISPLLSHIDKQHRLINKHVEELNQRQREFSAVTENMNEGLVLLNEKGIILSINPSAENIFEITENSVGKNLLEVERDIEIYKKIDDAFIKGSSEMNFNRNGREYQLNISKIGSDKNISGVALLIFDVTEKIFAERNRREFTANVSHELKTPLQSIMGSSELIENGLVKNEDMPEFIGNIRKESARLLVLIEDIIRLSQLDEKDEMVWEDINCLDLSKNIIKSLEPKAEEKNITLSLEGEKIMVNGVYQLLSEIIYNLLENSIKYNKNGGSGKITLSEDKENVYISVKDTGIGIPKEEQDRVFERFYRVDKSHSKQTGGTGLGLSIVKNAVIYLGGKINLESEIGKGTQITITLPKNR